MKIFHEIPLKENDRRAIEEAVRVLREQFSIEKGILFGSKARGTDDPEFDIDLLVLTCEPLGWREQRKVISVLYEIELNHDVVLSPLIVSTQEWQKGPYTVLPIYDEIERDGMAA